MHKGLFGELKIGEEKGASIPSATNSMQNMCLKGRIPDASGKAIKDRKVFGSQQGACDWQWNAASQKLATRSDLGRQGQTLPLPTKLEFTWPQYC